MTDRPDLIIALADLAALMQRSESAVRAFLNRRGVYHYGGVVKVTELVPVLHRERSALTPRVRRHADTLTMLQRKLLGTLAAIDVLDAQAAAPVTPVPIPPADGSEPPF